MKSRQIMKMVIDIMMTGVLLFLMAYALIGEAAHEWLGMAMFVLFIVHHILNAGWIKNMGKGKYTVFRAAHTVLAVLVLCTMLGSMVSGILLSRHVFDFLPEHGGQSIAQTVHMLCGYWGFVLMSLHLGFHWNRMVAMARKNAVLRKQAVTWICRVITVLIAGYGAYAFYKRQIGDYLLSRTMFAFFDYSENLWLFTADYLAVMGMFVLAGYYTSRLLRKKAGRNEERK